MFKHILVPTDGSELSAIAIKSAITFARETGAALTFFYARPDFPMPIYGEGALIDPTTPEQFAQSAEAEAKCINIQVSLSFQKKSWNVTLLNTS